MSSCNFKSVKLKKIKIQLQEFLTRTHIYLSIYLSQFIIYLSIYVSEKFLKVCLFDIDRKISLTLRYFF